MRTGSPFRVLRQHHAIEHATVTLLQRRLPGVPIIARSDLQGFLVFGDVSTVVLREAVGEALKRLLSGEVALAIHPNCGTNLVAAGTLSGVAAFVAGSGQRRSLWDRIPSAILAATAALLIAPPLGRWLQSTVTTTAEVTGLRIADVTVMNRGRVAVHRVSIVDEADPS